MAVQDLSDTIDFQFQNRKSVDKLIEDIVALSVS